MRVSHITASLTAKGGGIPIALQSLAQAQCDCGISCRVIGHDDGGSPLASWPAGSVCALPPRPIPGLPWAPTMGEEIAASQPDLLHTHGLWSQGSIAVPSASRRLQVPYLVSPHGMLDHWALAHSSWKKRIAAALFEGRHLRGATCLHALCMAEVDAMRAYGLKNPICVIPNGVEVPQKLKAETLKAEMKTLLFLGRLHPKKGLVNALRAWSKIRGQGAGVRSQEEWQFVVAGWDQGGHEAELKRLCDELGLPWADVPAAEFVGDPSAQHGHPAPLGKSAAVIDTPLQSPNIPISEYPNVLFLGPAFGEQKDALLRLASAFMLPSFSEGLPMSVLEAWSYGLPVLMTDHCNLPEGFAAEAALRCGTDVESIAEGLRSLLASGVSDLTAMGDRGRVLVEQRFTWPQVAAQMKEVYEWVLGGAPRPCSVIL